MSLEYEIKFRFRVYGSSSERVRPSYLTYFRDEIQKLFDVETTASVEILSFEGRQVRDDGEEQGGVPAEGRPIDVLVEQTDRSIGFAAYVQPGETRYVEALQALRDEMRARFKRLGQ